MLTEAIDEANELYTMKIKSKPLGSINYEWVSGKLTLQEKSSQYLSYDTKTTVLTATFGSFEMVQEKFGENKITITLTDKGGASQEYDISLNLILGVRDVVEGETVVEEVVEIKELDTNPVTARIEDISTLGEVLIRFNTPMKNESVNTTHINSTWLSLYIEPA